MKEVFYNNEKKYLITDKEFKEASEAWDKGVHFWCQRLEAMLPVYFKNLETPRAELGKKVFVFTTTTNPDTPLRCVKKDDKYFEILGDSQYYEIKFPDDKSKKEFEKKLVLQEDYYNKQK